MIQIHSSADIGAEGIKCMVYGGSGTGKTPLAATAPNPLLISAENGLLSIKRCNPPVAYIPIRGYKDLEDVMRWCQQSTEARYFATLCLDSLSEVMEVLLDEEKRKNKDPRKAYGNMADEGLKIARFFRDLPNKCIVLIAKEEFVKDESTGLTTYQPMMPGTKLGNQLPYFFDETFQMVVGKDANNKDYRALRTRRTFQHVARDRSGLLDEFEQPNLTYVFNKILGY